MTVWLPASGVAKRLGVDRRSVTRWLAEGSMPPSETRDGLRVWRQLDIDEWAHETGRSIIGQEWRVVWRRPHWLTTTARKERVFRTKKAAEAFIAKLAGQGPFSRLEIESRDVSAWFQDVALYEQYEHLVVGPRRHDGRTEWPTDIPPSPDRANGHVADSE